MSSKEPSPSESAAGAPKRKPPAKKTARPPASKAASGTASKVVRPAAAKAASGAGAAKGAPARPAKKAAGRPAQDPAGRPAQDPAAVLLEAGTSVASSDERVVETESAPPPPARPTGFQLLVSMGRPRATRGQLVVALLCGLLGFALVTQVHSQAGSGLSSARQADLVDVLDNLSAKSDQLRSQITDEQNTLSKLTGGVGQNEAALQEAQQRATTLQILAGTVGATGPGIDLRITDPDRKITADVLLDTLEELRDAGAEAVEIRGSAPTPSGSAASATPTSSAPGSALAVRLVASSYFVDSLDGQGVVVDGTLLAPPYDMLAIGDPPTLSQAMGIPGGVLDTLKGKGASGAVTESASVRITALHALTPPKYAHPAASAAS